MTREMPIENVGKGHDTDVLVIGGGVIGVCSAYYLAKAGRSVTLIDQGDICSGSSYGNAGWVVPSHSFPLANTGAVMQALRWMFNPDSPFYIKPRLDLDLFKWLWRFRAAANSRTFQESISVMSELGNASLALYNELIDAESIDCKYQQRGLLGVFRSRQAYEEGEREALVLKQHGISARMLTPDEVITLEPVVKPDNLGGIHFEQDSNLKPDDFVLGLASRFEKLGGIVHSHVKLNGFAPVEDGTVSAKTSNGEYKAQHVVLAAGSWSMNLAKLLGINVPVQPAKGYSVTFNLPDDSPTRPIMMFGAKCGLTPMGSYMRIAGTLELSGINDKVSQRRVDAMLRAVGEYFTTKINPLEGKVWSGLRPLSPDGRPMIGSLDKNPNVVVATGHSMTGLTLGPVTGKLVAQQITGEVPIVDPKPFSLSRFN